MKIDSTNFCSWEFDKALFICKMARQLGMDLDGYGEMNVNKNSGYTYLWLEDYPFTLFMNINCELEKKDVWVLFNDSYTGEETEETLDSFSGLDDIYEWCAALETSQN
jgi:hypothetical protein